ncbi:hypothetical protein [Aquimarina rhabdastrellae]
MKTLKVFILAFVIGTAMYGNNNPVETPVQKLRNEISTLLKNPRIEIDNEAINATVEFTLNNKGEIVVLTVDSDSTSVESFVKSKLNYQKVDSRINKNGKVFKLRLKILNPFS